MGALMAGAKRQQPALDNSISNKKKIEKRRLMIFKIYVAGL